MGPLVRKLTLRAAAVFLLALPAQAAVPPDQAIRDWYRLVIELVRHTPTYSPPVASRAFAYVGVTAQEALATDPEGPLLSLAGQANGLGPGPARDPGAHDAGAVVNAALAVTVRAMFANTGPTGQRALDAMERRLTEAAEAALPPDVAARSAAHGRAVAAHVLAWAEGDGGAVVDNLGFPEAWRAPVEPSQWVPTSAIPLQQAPLLPEWGRNRPFAKPGSDCPLPPHPPYSEDPGSAFWAEAAEVHAVWRTLTPEQGAIAQFWADDAMLSPTPPGHWVSIALQILARDGADGARHAEVLALLGMAVADAFIACWDEKYDHDLLRPVTYIRRHIDPKFQSVLITPPFPEYPSGHSVQSGAAEAVLAHLFGDPFAFEDDTHADDGLPARTFASFREAAEEAGISRLYGGIHYRAAIENGLEQGRCIGGRFTQIRTRR
ncbi:MAG TPA: vanadium-dependent haloperoxidase [Paracoccaceae bacterium]|nr:vanadium-dependent haloperoxidase [Paracoccaceae bacterium]